MSAYYNEIDPFAAQWIRNLIWAGLIAPGIVDERSIEDVQPGDLVGFTQCHFFAGIGVWSYALRQAGWPDDRPVWTGSCPCQPFSASGKRKGTADERHLWPAWFHLIDIERPPVIFGEQVASGDGLAWLDLVQADLEGVAYSCGAVVTPAAGYGAPHQRHRLYFVANAERHGGRTDEQRRGEEGRIVDGRDSGTVFMEDSCGEGCGKGSTSVSRREGAAAFIDDRGDTCIMADHRGSRCGSSIAGITGEKGAEKPDRDDAAGCRGNGVALGDTGIEGLEGQAGNVDQGDQPGRIRADEVGSATEASGPCNGFWSDAIWLPCRDGKARPTKPGISPLAHGAPGRVGYVCATCLQVAAEAPDDEDLQYMREISIKKNRGISTEILQPGVHGKGIFEGTLNETSGAESGTCTFPKYEVRAMRNRKRGITSTSQGSRCNEQCDGECPNPMQTLPQYRSHGDCEMCERGESEGYRVRIIGNRVGRLRAYGNAIVAAQATEFIKAAMEYEAS